MKLAAVGSNCIDYYTNIGGGTGYPGGGPVNMAVYTVRLGGQASYIGPVGDDPGGEMMRQAIAGKGVDVSHLYTKPGATAVSQVTLVDGERVFGDYDEGVLAEYRLSDGDLDFICTHDMVICDPEKSTCRLYEIKHTTERDDGQLCHLCDSEKLAYVEHNYGAVLSRTILYRGEDSAHSTGVEYMNVGNWLKRLRLTENGH